MEKSSPLRRGSHGHLVGALHQQLVEAGIYVPATELADEIFGEGTERAVKGYQRGHGLVADGVVGAQTLAALSGTGGKTFIAAGWRSEPSGAPGALIEVVRTAVGEIGTTEEPPGSNRGRRVDLYSDPDFGIPWCVSFVAWCFRRASDGSGLPIRRMRSSWGLVRWADKAGRVLPAGAEVLVGDVFVILRGTGGEGGGGAVRHGHVGIVVGVRLGDGALYTVEGNAHSAVRGLIRLRSEVTCIVRPSGAVPAAVLVAEPAAAEPAAADEVIA